MIVMSLMEFLSLGGKGVYVWSAYAITLVVLLVNVIVPRISQRKILDRVKHRIVKPEKQ